MSADVPARPVTFHPWSRHGSKRLYVRDGDTSLGYLDLETRAVHANAVADVERVREMFADLLGRQEPPPVRLAPLPFADLALNQPGVSIAEMAGAGFVDGRTAEERTAGVLAPLLTKGWKVIHSVPLAPSKDVDHLLVGPPGAIVLDTKMTRYPVRVQEGGSVLVDGYTRSWQDSLTQARSAAGEALSAALRFDVDPLGVVVAWAPVVECPDRTVVPGQGLLAHLESLPHVFGRCWQDVVFSTARRSDTWTAHHR